jgi:hypothetical protein
MTEPEVDAVLAQYSRGMKLERPEETDWGGQPLTRPSAYTITYKQNTDAQEGDHCVVVFFDYDGLVVGKSVSVYQR